jgi:hypothetical protein
MKTVLLAVVLYFGSLLALSRSSVFELKELARLLVTRAGDAASTAAG